jgi:hypothetical protein
MQIGKGMGIRRESSAQNSGEKCGDLESLYGKTMEALLLVAASEWAIHLGNNYALARSNVEPAANHVGHVCPSPVYCAGHDV